MTSRRKPNARRYRNRGRPVESSELSGRLKGSRSLFRRPCIQCGKPLDGREPYWMVAFPNAAHEKCIIWSERPCPFDDAIKHLKKAEHRVNEPGFSRALHWLERTSRTWPRRAYPEAVRSGFEAIKRMRIQAAQSLPEAKVGSYGKHTLETRKKA